MDQEQADSFRDIRGAIEAQGQQTRGEIGKVHTRIDVEKDERKNEAAAHNLESSLRAKDLEHLIADAKKENGVTDGKVEGHTKWHKDQKTSNRGMWLAIGIAILGALLGIARDCATHF